MATKSKLMARFDIIGRRRLWYTVSVSILIPTAVALGVFGLKLGIDFTGGSVLEISGNLDREQITEASTTAGVENLTINTTEAGRQIIRYRVPNENQQVQEEFERQLGQAGGKIERFDQIGPSVSKDLVKNALIALAVMSIAIVLYISWSFRRVPKGIKSYKFGLATVVAAFGHDGLFVLGMFAFLGRFFGVQVDTFIVTAILTVIGFSIHDTVVVFDRIREKLEQGRSDLKAAINESISETLTRSLNTSLVIILVLLALFLFGSFSTRYFILALILGMVSGTYSSIFIASPLLYSWKSKPQAK